MSTQTVTPKTVIAFPYSGDYRIDVLLPGENVKWEPSVPAGTARTVTFSFAQLPAYLESAPDAAEYTAGFTPLTSAQKAATRQILAMVSERIMVNFVEVTETTQASTPTGQIRLVNNTQKDSSGYALQPYNSGPVDGDVFLNVGSINDSFEYGAFMYDTILHEITHALGLKHPGDYNAGQAASNEPGNYLASSEDSELTSLMSYTQQTQGLARVDYAPYDLLALGYLYGLRSLNTGDNTYSYTDNIGQQLQTLIDNGGTDTLDLRAITTPTTIDLRAGQSSSLGRTSASGDASQSNLQMAFNTLVENCLGSPQDDTITGNGANNLIDGDAGNDRVVFAGNSAQYKLAFDLAMQQLRVSDTDKDRDGTDTLSRVEALQFSDKLVPVVSASHGSYADLPVGLYQFFITAFNAAPGVTYMDQLAEAYRYGLSVKQIVDIFTTKKQFTDVYPTTLSHGQLAQALVTNIVKTSASDATKQAAVKDITDAMDLAHWTVGQVIYQVFGNLANFAYSDPTWGNTAKQFANEIAVAKTYTDTLSQSTTDLATLRSVMAPISHLTDVSTPEVQISLIGQALLD
jgi:serralysin